jgi:hypothetical protein
MKRIASPSSPSAPTPASSYFDSTGRDDVLSGGVKLIPITMPKGSEQRTDIVWALLNYRPFQGQEP